MIAHVKQYMMLLFTWTYTGPLHYYTLDPIKAIDDAQDNGPEVRRLLAEFRRRKEHELHFVQRAATLSAAAVIGAKSWSDVAQSFWLAQVAWNCSLILSVVALISSNQERLLAKIPDPAGIGAGFEEAALRDALLIMLVKVNGNGVAGDPEKALSDTDTNSSLRQSPWIILLWQTPMMLMHYSWLTFLIGYEMYLITPLIKWRGWSVQCTGAVIATIVGVVLVGIFHVNAVVTRRALDSTNDKQNDRTEEREVGVDLSVNVENRSEWQEMHFGG